MHVVGSGFGDDVHGCAAGAAQFRTVVAAVDLEFLHRFLAHGGAHAASVIVGFATINGHAVAATVAAIKAESALRSLPYTKILVRSQTCGIANAGGQQGVCQIVATVDRQVFNILLIDHVRLAGSFSFYHRHFGGDFH